MGKGSITFFVTLFLLTTCLDSSVVTVVIGENHPWEEASGRRFWYTLVYQEGGYFEHIELPVGTRKVELFLPRGKTTILAAYPLGNGAPLGGAYQSGKDVELLYENGPLAEALHHLSKFYHEPLEVIAFDYLAKIVLEERGEGDGFDWNYLAQEIVNGTLSERSLKLFPLVDITLIEIPVGYWISERRGYPSFYSFINREVVVENLPPGINRYINLEMGMELRIVVSPQEPPFWHITGLDTLLMISDSAYQKLLESSY